MNADLSSRRVSMKGEIRSEEGLSGFPEDSVWSADDRILALCSQSTGGLASLIFHGGQPQSANAYILNHRDGAVLLSLEIESETQRKEVSHRFQRAKIMPYGWQNSFDWKGLTISSRFCAFGSSLIWEIHCTNHLDEPVKTAPVLHFNQAALSSKVNGQRTWSKPIIDRDGLQLVARDQLQLRDWIDVPGFRDDFIDEETIVRIAGIYPVMRVQASSLRLDAAWVQPGETSQPAYFTVVCGRTAQQVNGSLSRLRANPEAPFEEQAQRYTHRARSHPTLAMPRFPGAEAIFALAPMYTEAMKVAGTGALRSSAGGYYFVWGWDNLMGGHELSHWGDLEGARELLQFISSHRAGDGSVPHRYDNDMRPLQVTGFDFISQLFISLLYQYYAETLDQQALLQFYPVARQIFEGLSSSTDERGYYRSLGMYPDAPLQLGRTSDSYVSYEIGFYYCTCRMMEILANRCEDQELAKRAATAAAAIQSSYIHSFFDSRKGFLVDAIGGHAITEDHGESNGTYPRYALFPMHNSFGAWLLRPVQTQLSQFIQRELFRPDGIRMVPEWDAHRGTETVTSSCWFLHFDLYCLKVFRRAGDGDAIVRWLQLAQDYLEQRHVIPELQMMAPPGFSGQRWQGEVGQIWQLFALTGWLRGVLEGVIGLETDIGGLTYIPCNLDLDITLRDFPFREGFWDIEISGSGKWVENMWVDLQPVMGSLKLPLECYTPGKHHLRIIRAESPSPTPLILEAAGAGISSLQADQKRLTARLKGSNEVNLVFYSPSPPEVALDGKVVDTIWNPTDRVATTSFSIRDEAELRILCR